MEEAEWTNIIYETPPTTQEFEQTQQEEEQNNQNEIPDRTPSPLRNKVVDRKSPITFRKAAVKQSVEKQMVQKSPPPSDTGFKRKEQQQRQSTPYSSAAPLMENDVSSSSTSYKKHQMKNPKNSSYSSKTSDYQTNRSLGNESTSAGQKADVNEIISQVETVIGKRFQVKKARIENNFRQVQGPNAMFQMQDEQSASRLEQYNKYESAFTEYANKMEGVIQLYDKGNGTLRRMMGSIIKSTNSMTQEVEKIRDNVETCVRELKEASDALESNLKSTAEEATNCLETEFKTCKKACYNAEDREVVASANILGSTLMSI